MEIERDTALRGWWLEYDGADEKDKGIIQFRENYVKPNRVFVSDRELKELYPVIKKFGKPYLEAL